MTHRVTRRTFVKTAAVAGLATPYAAVNRVRAQSASEKLNIAFVGVGGDRRLSYEFRLRRRGRLHLLLRGRRAPHGQRRLPLARGQGLHRLPRDVRQAPPGDRRGDDRRARSPSLPRHHDRHAVGQTLLHAKAPDSHALGSSPAHPCRQEVQARHPDGQPGSRRRRHPHHLRVDPLRGARRHLRGPHLDQPPHLAAGHRPARG